MQCVSVMICLLPVPGSPSRLLVPFCFPSAQSLTKDRLGRVTGPQRLLSNGHFQKLGEVENLPPSGMGDGFQDGLGYGCSCLRKPRDG